MNAVAVGGRSTIDWIFRCWVEVDRVLSVQQAEKSSVGCLENAGLWNVHDIPLVHRQAIAAV